MRENILIIASFAESLINFRGALIKQLLILGYKVEVAAPDFDDDIRTRLTNMGAITHTIALERNGLNPLTDIATFFSLNKLIRQINPSRILCYTVKPVIYTGLLCKLHNNIKFFPLITGLGFIFSQHKRWKNKIIAVLARALYRIALSNAEKIIFQNPDDQQLFLKYGILRSIKQSGLVNGSGVDLNYFTFKKLPENESCFLLIARLLDEKGIREYVKAARMVRESNPQSQFLLAGWLDSNPGSISKSELEVWIEEGVIEFLGKLGDVRPSILRATVYVLPSYREGTPRTVLEAMAMGRPIITSDAPGCRETVEEGINGYLVPIRNVVGLVEKMNLFSKNPGQAVTMGMQSRRIAEDKFDVDKVNKTLLRHMGIL